ncbi:DUF2933 domain-containing protein [Falsihalocynthiibacter sp. BN13B15]
MGSNLTAFSPIILCVGAHIFMHEVMNKKVPRLQENKTKA